MERRRGGVLFPMIFCRSDEILLFLHRNFGSGMANITTVYDDTRKGPSSKHPHLLCASKQTTKESRPNSSAPTSSFTSSSCFRLYPFFQPFPVLHILRVRHFCHCLCLSAIEAEQCWHACNHVGHSQSARHYIRAVVLDFAE